jgi:hypothetical protein
MKKLLLITGLTLILVLFCTIILYSQTSTWRGATSTPRVSTQLFQQSIPQRNVSSWRNESPREFNRPVRTRPGSNIIVNDPWLMNNWGWGWNRWDMWGAPAFGWNFWSPMWYMNDWGYRQPARVYVYDNGRRDTIKGKKPIISFGIQRTTDDQVGGFFTIGNKGYFIVEYTASNLRDNSTFFPFGNIADVDFPMVNDLIQRQSFYIGIGKRIKRTGVHMMIGTVSEDAKWRGKDDLGYITFPKYLDRFTTVKIGALHDFKNLTLKLDHDPIVKNTTFGLGLNF